MNRVEQMSPEEFRLWNEELAKRYGPEHYHEAEQGFIRWGERSRVQTLLHLLEVHPSHRVLEVGVGAGNILEQVHAAERVGMDLSTFLLAKARKRLGESVSLLQGDAEELTRSFAPASFDRVYCSEVLEHVQHPDRVLAGIAAVLRPDGIAVVSVPNERVINRYKSFLHRLGLLRWFFPHIPVHMEDEWHVHVFDRSLLLGLSSECFTVSQVTAVPSSLLPLRYVVKRRPKT